MAIAARRKAPREVIERMAIAAGAVTREFMRLQDRRQAIAAHVDTTADV